MLDLNEKYIVNKQQKTVAVQLDIETFRRMEEVLEDYALGQYMQQAENDNLNVDDAKKFYKQLTKKNCEGCLLALFEVFRRAPRT